MQPVTLQCSYRQTIRFTNWPSVRCGSPLLPSSSLICHVSAWPPCLQPAASPACTCVLQDLPTLPRYIRFLVTQRTSDTATPATPLHRLTNTSSCYKSALAEKESNLAGQI